LPICVLLLACVDDFKVDEEEGVVEGAGGMLVPPLLSMDLGNASASRNAYNVGMAVCLANFH
jgi:hypothetical protein